MAKFGVLSTVSATLRYWAQLLTGGLSFDDNFVGFEWEGTIDAGQEVRITHGLGVIPTRFMVLYTRGGIPVASDLHAATADFFYMRNIASTTQFSGKIRIMP